VHTAAWFDQMIMITVIGNTANMALVGYLADPVSLQGLSMANLVFSCIFIGEMGLKNIGLGPHNYVRDP